MEETKDINETAAEETKTAEKKKKASKQNEIDALKAEIETLKAEAKEKDDKYLRLAAEYDNFRRRSREEKDATYSSAMADTVTELLPIIDNLERAAQCDAEGSVKEGLIMISKSVEAVLAKAKSIFFVGIGGISMSGLAQILMANGFNVSGSDNRCSELTEELERNGYAKENIEKYLGLFKLLEEKTDVAEGVAFLAETLGEYLDADVVKNMTEIATAVNATKAAQYELVFDPTLVRGMSYYTGTIFEIAMPEFGGACGGGGRYDKMVGKFTGNDVPACGFSIGFERIILLLMESGFQIPESPKKVAYLVEKNYPADKLVEVMKQAKEARENNQQVLVVRMNKNKKFQKEQLTNEGYEEFVEFFNN